MSDDLFEFAREQGRHYLAAFDGKTISTPKDASRLNGQMRAVFALMQDGAWRTLSEIALHIKGSEAGVSARLRDLRKEKYGAHKVLRKRVGQGLFAYSVVLAAQR